MKRAASVYDLRCAPGRLVLDLRKWRLPGVAVLGRHRFVEAHPPLPPHRHPDMEICYLAKGEQIFRVGRRRYHLRSGDVYITLPGEIHDTGQQPLGRGILYWLIVQLSAKSACTPRLLSATGPNAVFLIDQLGRLPQRKFPGLPHLHSHLKRVFELATHSSTPLMRLRMEHELMGFLLAVLDSVRLTETAHHSPWLRELEREIVNSPAKPWKITEMAAKVGLSVSHFKTRFRTELGMPPWEFILRTRITAAREQLRHTNCSVTDIALELGFSSSQHFATSFRKFVGVSPSAYRRGP